MKFNIGDKVRYVGDNYDACKGLIGVIKAKTDAPYEEYAVNFGEDFYGHTAPTEDYFDADEHSWYVIEEELEKVEEY